MVKNNFETICLLLGLASLWTSAFCALCDQFFQGAIKFPEVKGQSTAGVVKLCQNHYTNGVDGPELYATLFDTVAKIPIYSANAITIDPYAQTYPRPGTQEWKRVSRALCAAALPGGGAPFLSRITAQGTLPNCDLHQALDSDYRGNTQDLTRGHLCPNSIMKRERERQLGTFTLTNAAPQYTLSNNLDWSRIECVAEQAIIKLSPNEKVYVITGVNGTSSVKLNNRVEVPETYWKLVCYPGYNGNEAWAFGIVRDNAQAMNVPTRRDYQELHKVVDEYFTYPDIPFAASCYTASKRRFDSFINSHWNPAYGTINQCK